MAKLGLQDLDLKEKRVLMRVDFNVPLNQDGSISDDTRLRESLPSIQYILEKGGSVILMSHLGRPKNRDAKLSLKPCSLALSKLLGERVLMAEDCVGDRVAQMVRNLKPGQILLLENLRFHPEEENPALNLLFAKQLSDLGDVYVNDAFGASHRNHTSVTGIASFFPGKSAAGFLLQKEIQALGALIAHPTPPFYAIIGGSKISTKMGVLKSLLAKVDGIFIGGGMAFTFYKAQGIPIGGSIHEDGQIPIAEEFIEECAKNKISLQLPIDLVIADALDQGAHVKICSAADGVPEGWQGMDIGPQTIIEWKKMLKNAGTIFWNGPLGVFEISSFAKGTEEVAKALSSYSATTVVGGGDSVAAINRLGLSSKFSHVSTGGGASLEYIEFGHLPGIDVLTEKN